jgi:hypothetical protein
VLAVPLLGLLLLLRLPTLDVRWEHHPAHFWLVLITAVLSAVWLMQPVMQPVDAEMRDCSMSLSLFVLRRLSGAARAGNSGVLLDKANTGF